MPRLPAISGEDLVSRLERKGYRHVRTRGSHARLYPPHGSALKKVTVPLHAHLKKGTLSDIMKDAGLTVEDLQ
ncbi:MAG TPA: type II toxin-antitoxin system HicA family toxin [Candidatus Paceibacterota bacterium]